MHRGGSVALVPVQRCLGGSGQCKNDQQHASQQRDSKCQVQLHTGKMTLHGVPPSWGLRAPCTHSASICDQRHAPASGQDVSAPEPHSTANLVADLRAIDDPVGRECRSDGVAPFRDADPQDRRGVASRAVWPSRSSRPACRGHPERRELVLERLRQLVAALGPRSTRESSSMRASPGSELQRHDLQPDCLLRSRRQLAPRRPGHVGSRRARNSTSTGELVTRFRSSRAGASRCDGGAPSARE